MNFCRSYETCVINFVINTKVNFYNYSPKTKLLPSRNKRLISMRVYVENYIIVINVNKYKLTNHQ